VDDHVESAIYGTTLRGLPNHHRIEGCELVREARTAPIYRMLSPDGSYPLLVEDRAGGASFPCEIYRIPRARWDDKVANEPPGLVVGEIELEDGTTAVAMLADPAWLAAQTGVQDITVHGGWAAYAATR
jgi:gamma-glutamylcyclotransferase (GGCT)/AIG2-like uncharacterized protein YtfP